MTAPPLSKLRLILVAALAVTAIGCGSSGVSIRPTTDAKLIIVSPTPNQVTGPDVTAQFQVIGGTVLPPAQARGPIRGDQGHIHVSIDGKLIVMAYSDHADLSGLTPGPHALQASWVATDHLPFANRVVAAVLFQVQS